jgi:glycosyltransferase involved in cell wall biosynthesis
MRRVLLITFLFPPSPSIGAVRPGGLAKYLPRFGWEPVVLAPRLPAGSRPAVRVIETDYRDVIASLKAKVGLDPSRGLQQQLELKRSSKPGVALPHSNLINWVRSVVSYPDETKGWIPFATKAIEELARKERVDAVFSTSPPISTHLIAARAKTVLGCPCAADFRDLWSDDGAPTIGLHLLASALEKRTLRAADALITVSDPWAEYLRRRYPGKLVARATNGFDPDEYPAGPSKLDSSFSITYTGDLYQGKRDPSLLFEVLAEMILAGAIRKDEVQLNFFGSSDQWLPALANRLGLSDVLRIHGFVPRSESLRHQRESQILLLLGRNVPSDAGCYAGKLFEYLASHRPILALGGLPGVTGQLLEETGTGRQVFSRDDLRAFLTTAYGEFQASREVCYNGRPDSVAEYTHSTMTKRIADVLDLIVTGA